VTGTPLKRQREQALRASQTRDTAPAVPARYHQTTTIQAWSPPVPLPKPLAQMNPAERILYTVEVAGRYLPADLAAQLQAMVTPQTALALGAYAAAHAVGVGFIADGVGLGLAIPGLVGAISKFDRYLRTTLQAKHPMELANAGRQLSEIATPLVMNGATFLGVRGVARAARSLRPSVTVGAGPALKRVATAAHGATSPLQASLAREPAKALKNLRMMVNQGAKPTQADYLFALRINTEALQQRGNGKLDTAGRAYMKEHGTWAYAKTAKARPPVPPPRRTPMPAAGDGSAPRPQAVPVALEKVDPKNVGLGAASGHTAPQLGLLPAARSDAPATRHVTVDQPAPAAGQPPAPQVPREIKLGGQELQVVDLTREECAELHSIGITPKNISFNPRTEETGYSSITLTTELQGLEWKLAALPNAARIVKKFTSGSLREIYREPAFEVRKSILYPAFERAEYLIALYKQRLSPNDFLDPDPKYRPFAFYIDSTPQEIDRQLSLLQRHGIDDVKIGLEVEFALHESPAGGDRIEKFPIEGFTEASKIQADVIKKLELDYASPNSANKSGLRIKIDAIRGLTPREILMLDLIEVDPRTKDILEPLFGKGRDGHGYYDGRDKLELKLKHTSPKEIIENRRLLIQVLHEKANKYGLVFVAYPSYHINFSFWSGGENILDGSSNKFDEYAPGIVAGITRAAFEALPIGFSHGIGPHMPIDLTTERTSVLRYSSDRIEAREFSAPDTIIPILLAGAAHGVGGERDFDLLPVKKVLSLNVHHTPNQYKLVAHALNASTVNSDGSLNVPKSYLGAKAWGLLHELEGSEEPPATFFSLFSPDERLVEGLFGFFSKARIVKHGGNSKIEWPATEQDNFVLPFGHGGKTATDVDIGALKANVHVNGFVYKYITGGAYEPTKAPAGDNNFYVRGMLDSSFLKRILSPGFVGDLINELNHRS
jgi:hypothetical protein